MQNPRHRLESVGLTDVGRKRTRNEDTFEISSPPGLAVVCDGMGGHVGGDVASRSVADSVIDFVFEYDPSSGDDEVVKLPADRSPEALAVAIIRGAVQMANRRLVAINQDLGHVDGQGAGTTVVGHWLVEGSDRLVVFHAGDSRAYRLRSGRLEQLTHDHSLFQSWVDSGQHGSPPQRNIITRCIGIMAEVEPDVSVHALETGDLYLLCSDGLTSMIEDEDIAGILAAAAKGELEEAAAELIARANDAGGHDNVTVVLSRWNGAAGKKR